MKIYIAGPITGIDNYKENFNTVSDKLAGLGFRVMNPAILPEGFEWDEYMSICIPMLKCCHAIVMLNGWEQSRGARAEYEKALELGMYTITEKELFADLLQERQRINSRLYDPFKRQWA